MFAKPEGSGEKENDYEATMKRIHTIWGQTTAEKEGRSPSSNKKEDS